MTRIYVTANTRQTLDTERKRLHVVKYLAREGFALLPGRYTP